MKLNDLRSMLMPCAAMSNRGCCGLGRAPRR